MAISIYDYEKLALLLQSQLKHNYHLENDIIWSEGIDLNKPLVALNNDALGCPGASSEQRLVISQLMGLVISTCIFEMEECLIRLRNLSFEQYMKKFPLGPEFYDLGENFFIEEAKHSEGFKRYTYLFAEELGIDPKDLRMLLPLIENTLTESFFKHHILAGGMSFWWIVAIVEQHFLYMYKILKPHKKIIDPLYFDLHHKHYLEEARHAPFPYLMLNFLEDRRPHLFNKVFNKVDLATAHVVQGIWAVRNLIKSKEVKKLKGKHHFFDTLISVLPHMEKYSFPLQFWKLFTGTPYVSTLINPTGHAKILQFAKEKGAITIPAPECYDEDLVNY